MLNLREVYRPKTIEQALTLLEQPGTVVFAGGTELIASGRRDVRAVVDLSGLNLAYIRDKDGAVAIGAMTTLGDVAESPILRAAANGVVAQSAHASVASLLRNQVTVAGTLIAEPAGILATVLVAMEASLTLRSPLKGEERVRLADFLAKRAEFSKNAIVTEVTVPASSLVRRAAIETVARTPRDKPIVSVCAAIEIDNNFVRTCAVALGGVGDVAVCPMGVEEKLGGNVLTEELIESAAREATNHLDPPADLRGTAQYRREMVRVLTARALRSIASS